MMSCSMENRDIFHNLQLEGIFILLNILSNHQASMLSHVRMLFSQESIGFAETLDCVLQLNMVKLTNEDIFLNIDSFPQDENKRREVVLENIFKTNNRYKSEIQNFITQFNAVDGNITYSPSAQNRSQESSVRNFLIRMGVVTYMTDADLYFINLEYMNLYVDAVNKSKFTSKAALRQNLLDKNRLGDSAEKLIYIYEKKRVGKLFASKIEHVSQKNVSAGYDIQSITQLDGDKILPRFIEVKAVPGEDYRFYWSRNERDVAKSLGAFYYLYLLPVDSRQQFNINELKIIENPCDIITNRIGWDFEPDAIMCYKKLSG